MEHTIKVTGKSKISAKPDTVQLSIELHGVKPKYEDAMELSSAQSQELADRITPLGFEQSDLKTTSFGIDPQYEGYNDHNGNYRQRFKGYAYHHALILRFPVGDMLGRVLTALAGCSADPQFSIGYLVSDNESVKDELLARSVADSRRKAEILANAAGVRLGDIITIDYSWAQTDVFVAPMARMNAPVMAKCEGAAFDFDISPDDIDMTDTVTVVWEIK